MGTRLLQVDAPHVLVIENWGAYLVEHVDSSTSRLIGRLHADRSLLGVAYVLFIELPHAIMEFRMMRGIKDRAERHHPRARVA